MSLQINPYLLNNCNNKNEVSALMLLNHLFTTKGIETELRVATKFHNALIEKCNDIQFVELQQSEGK